MKPVTSTCGKPGPLETSLCEGRQLRTGNCRLTECCGIPCADEYHVWRIMYGYTSLFSLQRPLHMLDRCLSSDHRRRLAATAILSAQPAPQQCPKRQRNSGELTSCGRALWMVPFLLLPGLHAPSHCRPLVKCQVNEQLRIVLGFLLLCLCGANAPVAPLNTRSGKL